MAQLTKHKRFQQLFELSEGDVRLPKLFRQTVSQLWPDGGKTAKILAHPISSDKLKVLASSQTLIAMSH